MTNLQDNNNEETVIIKGESKGGDNSRTRTASLIALVLIPFILFATIHVFFDSESIVNSIFWIYNQFFAIVLGLGLIYAIHELVNFITPKETKPDEYLGNMVTASIVFGLWYFLPIYYEIFSELASVEYLGIFNLFYFNASSEDWTTFTSILIPILFIVGILITVILNFDTKDVLVIMFTGLLVAMFFKTFEVATTVGGWETIFLVLAIVVTSDTMAYFGGKNFGKTKAFPKVSPNKTVEGLLIGFVSAIVVGYVFFILSHTLFGPELLNLAQGESFNNIGWWFLVIPALSAVAPLGDLYFSKIKRTYNKKDFSDLLPGHGGLLDRIDSHILVFSILGLMTIFI